MFTFIRRALGAARDVIALRVGYGNRWATHDGRLDAEIHGRPEYIP
jgi:hypothetical protein